MDITIVIYYAMDITIVIYCAMDITMAMVLDLLMANGNVAIDLMIELAMHSKHQ